LGGIRLPRVLAPARVQARLQGWGASDVLAHGSYGVRAEITSSVVSEDGASLTIGLRVLVLEPFPGRAPVPDSDAQVLVGDAVLSVEELGWVTAQGSRHEFGLRATLPLAVLDDGVHEVRLRLAVAGRSLTLRAWPTDGVLRAARRRTAAGRWLQVRSGNGGVVLVIQTTLGTLPHARWMARQMAADLVFATRPRELHQLAVDMVREWRIRGVWMDRILRLATLPVRAGGPIWLIGERTDTAQDNGRAFFQHVRTKHPTRRAYYVIKRGAANAANVLPYGNVVWHDSLRHRILALQADALVGSHSIDRYLLPRAWAAKEYRVHLAWRIGSKRVYLKHGVLGVRTLAFELSKQGLDIVVASGKPEADYMRGTLGYDRQLKETGLPRYDLLVPQPPERVIVLMPTWRQYLVPPRGSTGAPDTFTGSNYERFFRELLGHPRLHAALERHDYTLEFYPHYNIDQYYRGARPPHPRIRTSSFRDREVKDALIECALFVTDWSSVVFDAAYLGRAIIHTPFDEAEYLWGHYGKGWFDVDVLGFGPVARDVESLVGHIEHYLASGCVREPEYTARVQQVFAHTDQGNSERVVEEIDRL
jgi:hypothetical protein